MTQQPDLSPMDNIANMFSVEDYMYFYQDHLTGERSDAETRAVVELLRMDQPRRRSLRVLDLACGFGRIANRLALLGHRVTGVEYLPGFLEIASSAAAQIGILDAGILDAREYGPSVHYEQGDMRQIDFDQEFDRALMMFNSFGYFTDAENFQVLGRLVKALKPGGLLGFDIANRDGVLANFQSHFVTEKGEALMINRFSFDVQSGRLHNQRIIIRDGQRKDLPFSVRLYSVSELRDLLARAGFALEQVYAEWDARPLEYDSPALVAVARRL
jgi:SAM-dependent methyltransferase